MYNYKKANRSSIKSKNEVTTGETIETKVKRMVKNKESIKDGAPIIYTEHSEGVVKGYDIRTDRFEIAAEAMDIIHKNEIAKKQGKPKMNIVKDDNNNGKTEPTEGTNNSGKTA